MIRNPAARRQYYRADVPSVFGGWSFRTERVDAEPIGSVRSLKQKSPPWLDVFASPVAACCAVCLRRGCNDGCGAARRSPTACWRCTPRAPPVERALLAPDPQPRDRVRTLGWASVVATATVVATVPLTRFAVWMAAALLVLLMFSSYALRSWSPRVASLALMGAMTVYVTGAGYITIGRIGWFVLAVAVGFGWLGGAGAKSRRRCEPGLVGLASACRELPRQDHRSHGSAWRRCSLPGDRTLTILVRRLHRCVGGLERP